MSDKYKNAMNEKESSLGNTNANKISDKERDMAAQDEAIKNAGFVPSERKQTDLNTPLGYLNLDINSLPSAGRFYPRDLQIQIRPANIEEIEHYSIINDNDPIDIDKHANDIVKACARAISSIDVKFDITDIIEGDRMYILLEIKGRTFPEGENELILDIECEECGNISKRELSANLLDVHSTASDKIEKYYNDEERCYNVETKSFGIIKLKPPRISLVEYIFNRVRTKQRSKQYWNKAFYSILPYTFPEISGKIKDIEIDRFYNEFKTWDKKKYSTVYRLAEMIKIGVNPEINITCDSCKGSVSSMFRIPGGAKNLFIISNIDDELI